MAWIDNAFRPQIAVMQKCGVTHQPSSAIPATYMQVVIESILVGELNSDVLMRIVQVDIDYAPSKGKITHND